MLHAGQDLCKGCGEELLQQYAVSKHSLQHAASHSMSTGLPHRPPPALHATDSIASWYCGMSYRSGSGGGARTRHA